MIDATPGMPLRPPTRSAWALLLTGTGALVWALWLQLPMWLVELGATGVAPGGGDYMIALLFGLPVLLVAVALIGLTVARRGWRSWLSCTLLVASLVPLAGWIVVFARGVSR